MNRNPRLPIVMRNGTLMPKPELILERIIKRKGSRAGELLVQRRGSDREDTTWVDVEELRQVYLELMDELF